MPQIPPPAQAARITSFLRDHPRWSVFWDKRYGLWRAAEDDPDRHRRRHPLATSAHAPA
jgi:hypothetical protein